MQLDDLIGGRLAEFQQKLTNIFTNGKGLSATRITAADAAALAKAAQEAGDAVDSTVAGFEAMSALTIAESKMTVAALGFMANESEAFVSTIEAAAETAEVMDNAKPRAVIALQRYQASRSRMRETTAALATEFTEMMMSGGQNQQRAIAPVASGQKRFTPSR